MSTSPLSPEDIRAAAEVHRELGPEYSDAVVAAFLEKVDREVAARVDARLAGLTQAPPAQPARPRGRHALAKALAIGACAGALVVGVVSHHSGSAAGVTPHHQVIVRAVPEPPVPPASGG